MAEEPKKSISDRLRGIGSQDAAPQPLPELATRTLTVSISDICEYKGNPRVYPNPEHESIKESIRTRGLLQQLVVTQEPGSSKFVLLQGGNTRLKCLRELYEETGDSKFAQIVCEYRPWTTEDDLLIGHYIENEQRGNLNWYEKSALVCSLHSMFEARSGGLPLQSTDFERQAATAGIRIRRNEVHLNRYTVERLGDRLPQLYQRGVGKRTIEKIRRFDLAASSIWRDAGLDEARFDEKFFEMLKDTDSGTGLPELIERISLEIADQSPINYRQLLGSLHNHVVDGLEPPKYADLQLPELKGMSFSTAVSTASPAATEMPGETRTQSESRKPGRLARRRANQRTAATLRGKIHHHARLFAEQTGNRNCMEQFRFGYGFIMLNFPKPLPDLPKETQVYRHHAWWLLLEMSGWQSALQRNADNLFKAARLERADLANCFDPSGNPTAALKIAAAEHGMSPPNHLSAMTRMPDAARRNFQRLLKFYWELTDLGRSFEIWQDEERYE